MLDANLFTHPLPRVLVENSEKLAVAVALHRLQAHQRDTHVAGAPPAAAALLLARLVAEAGRDSSAKEYEVGVRTRTVVVAAGRG